MGDDKFVGPVCRTSTVSKTLHCPRMLQFSAELVALKLCKWIAGLHSG